MAWRILKQPNGKLAIWSTIMDSLLGWNATPEEVKDFILQDNIKTAKMKADRTFERMMKNVDEDYSSYVDKMKNLGTFDPDFPDAE